MSQLTNESNKDEGISKLEISGIYPFRCELLKTLALNIVKNEPEIAPYVAIRFIESVLKKSFTRTTKCMRSKNVETLGIEGMKPKPILKQNLSQLSGASFIADDLEKTLRIGSRPQTLPTADNASSKKQKTDNK
ncbi:12513_t:CDS:2 [Ambispora gerdemannii]|uniref:12513_t:CDS:1 n=1 Tax=Ambispora gerdemannii TaxID=144530 RepID=A0A9N9C2E9_9GLOM|nr:12513_t:CDS:2 [Ambispora gerdemannii]